MRSAVLDVRASASFWADCCLDCFVHALVEWRRQSKMTTRRVITEEIKKNLSEDGHLKVLDPLTGAFVVKTQWPLAPSLTLIESVAPLSAAAGVRARVTLVVSAPPSSIRPLRVVIARA